MHASYPLMPSPPQERGLQPALMQYDMPMTRVLARMEVSGIGLDRRTLDVSACAIHSIAPCPRMHALLTTVAQ